MSTKSSPFTESSASVEYLLLLLLLLVQGCSLVAAAAHGKARLNRRHAGKAAIDAGLACLSSQFHCTLHRSTLCKTKQPDHPDRSLSVHEADLCFPSC